MGGKSEGSKGVRWSDARSTGGEIPLKLIDSDVDKLAILI